MLHNKRCVQKIVSCNTKLVPPNDCAACDFLPHSGQRVQKNIDNECESWKQVGHCLQHTYIKSNWMQDRFSPSLKFFFCMLVWRKIISCLCMLRLRYFFFQRCFCRLQFKKTLSNNSIGLYLCLLLMPTIASNTSTFIKTASWVKKSSNAV